MDLKLTGGKGIPRKHSFVQVSDFWNIVGRKRPDPFCSGISGVPAIGLG